MNYLKSGLATALFSFLFLFSCREPVSFSRIEYNIPSHINIKTDELEDAFKEMKLNPSAILYIKVTVYSYSSGSETISFSGEDVKTIKSGGKIRVLIKVMDNKKVIRAEFAEGAGNSKKELLSTLVKDVQQKLRVK